ncbi:MAG: hypothetical protein WCP98_03885 [Actinomycetes bacterium]
MTSAPTTFLFSGYARLPRDVSHQAMHKRVGVVLEADARDAETGILRQPRRDLSSESPDSGEDVPRAPA